MSVWGGGGSKHNTMGIANLTKLLKQKITLKKAVTQTGGGYFSNTPQVSMVYRLINQDVGRTRALRILQESARFISLYTIETCGLLLLLHNKLLWPSSDA